MGHFAKNTHSTLARDLAGLQDFCYFLQKINNFIYLNLTVNKCLYHLNSPFDNN